MFLVLFDHLIVFAVKQCYNKLKLTKITTWFDITYLFFWFKITVTSVTVITIGFPAYTKVKCVSLLLVTLNMMLYQIMIFYRGFGP